MDRRTFLCSSAVATASAALLSGPLRSEDDRPPALDLELVRMFVGRSHFDLDAVKELLGREPALINAAWDWGNGDWETGLGAAAHTGRREIAELILDHGARIDVFAATMLGHTRIVRVFLDELPRIHGVPGPHGIPLLSHAVVGRERAREILTLLLNRGADVNATSKLGVTPLMAAASIGDVETIELLLARGARPELADVKSRTALAWAEERGHEAAAQRLRGQGTGGR